ncbi:MAG: glycosyltransferase, partial [Limnochordia bacterium]
MLTWEYPPRVIGGLARHVHALSQGLVREGHEVVVVTGDDGQSPYHRTEQGVEVYRVKKYSPPTMDFLDSVFQLNLNM